MARDLSETWSGVPGTNAINDPHRFGISLVLVLGIASATEAHDRRPGQASPRVARSAIAEVAATPQRSLAEARQITR
jgi:hypothetical protein